MIWEKAVGLTPFGKYKGTVKTTSGTYKFYQGEPTWEPAGCNWTYLAFLRIKQQKSGTTDIDEILQYLITKGIVSTDSFLSSIEFGNEVSNFRGYCIIDKFEVDLQ